MRGNRSTAMHAYCSIGQLIARRPAPRTEEEDQQGAGARPDRNGTRSGSARHTFAHADGRPVGFALPLPGLWPEACRCRPRPVPSPAMPCGSLYVCRRLHSRRRSGLLLLRVPTPPFINHATAPPSEKTTLGCRMLPSFGESDCTHFARARAVGAP